MFRAFYYFIFFLKKQYRDKRENLFLFHKIFSVFVFSVYRDYRIFGKTTQHAHVQVSNRRYHILSATGCSHLCNALWVGYVVLWILSMLWAVFLIAKIIGTEYVILDDGTLCLRSGYLSSRRIAVTEIKSICTRQNNKAIFSSYVLSRRNVMLCLSNDKRPIRLSPKESEAFVSELLRRNPHIEIIDK